MIEDIIEIVENAGNILLKHFKSKELIVLTKKDEKDFVTNADFESEKYIKKELKKIYPNDVILAEESDGKISDYSKLVWVVDPLDGTKSFIKNNSSFAIMIGLLKDKKPILGVVYLPAKNKLYFAEKGKGAFLKTSNTIKKISTTNIEKLKSSRLLTYAGHDSSNRKELINKIPFLSYIPENSAGVKLCLIAEGKAEAHINQSNKCSKWDTCAPQIILEEAGGKLFDKHGNTLNYSQVENNWENGFAGTNGKINHELIPYLEKK